MPLHHTTATIPIPLLVCTTALSLIYLATRTSLHIVYTHAQSDEAWKFCNWEKKEDKKKKKPKKKKKRKW